MIEIKRCTFGKGNLEGVGVFEDGKIIAWKEWDILQQKPIKLTMQGIG